MQQHKQELKLKDRLCEEALKYVYRNDNYKIRLLTSECDARGAEESGNILENSRDVAMPTELRTCCRILDMWPC